MSSIVMGELKDAAIDVKRAEARLDELIFLAKARWGYPYTDVAEHLDIPYRTVLKAKDRHKERYGIQ